MNYAKSTQWKTTHENLFPQFYPPQKKEEEDDALLIKKWGPLAKPFLGDDHNSVKEEPTNRKITTTTNLNT